MCPGDHLSGGESSSAIGGQQGTEEVVRENNRDTEATGRPEDYAEAPATTPTPPISDALDTELLALVSTRTSNSTSANTSVSPPQLQSPIADHKQKLREVFIETTNSFKVRICKNCLREKLDARDAARDSPDTQRRPTTVYPLEDIYADCHCLRYWHQNENKRINPLKRLMRSWEERVRKKYAKVLMGPTQAEYPHMIDNSMMFAAITQLEDISRQTMKSTFGFAPGRDVFFLTFQSLYRQTQYEGKKLWRFERQQKMIPEKLYNDTFKFLREADWGFCSCHKLVDWNREYVIRGPEHFGQREVGIGCLGCGAWRCVIKGLGPIGPELIRAKGYNVRDLMEMARMLCSRFVSSGLYLRRGFPGGVSNGSAPGVVPDSQASGTSLAIVRFRPNPIPQNFVVNSGEFVLDARAFDEEEEEIKEILER
jgi:hypothetical protein